jgi:hypothetical protein
MKLRSILTGASLALALMPAGALADTDTTDLVLATDDCTNGPFRLGFGPGAKSGCNPGSSNHWTGTGTPTDFPAIDGLPLTLDPARKIHVVVSVGTFGGAVIGGIGNETVTLALTGKLHGSNATVSIASGSATMSAVDRIQSETVTYTIDLAPTADKAGVYKSLNLAVNRYGSVQSGYMDLNGASLISFPIIDGTQPPDPEEEEE